VRSLNMMRGAVLTTLVFFTLPEVASAATIWFVSPSGSGTNCATDGRSEATAFPRIQMAIDCAAGGDLVRVAAGTFTEDLSIAKNLSVIGAGKTATVIRSPVASTKRVVVSSATVTITKMKITGGRVGGILNNGTLMLSASIVSGNSNALDQTTESGGGIHNAGTLTVKGSSINNNRTNITLGGGIYNRGTLRLQNSQVNRNFAIDGGGIYSEGPTTITGSQIVGNGGDDGVGGLANYFKGGTVTVSGTKISANSGEFFGGIDHRGGTMVLKQSQVLDNDSENANAGGIANFGTNAVLTLQGTTIRGNKTDDLGGGIWVAAGSVSLSGSTVTMNTARDGGGIFNSGGSVSISADSTVSNNVPNDCVGC
jgi:hypothetical protein